MGFNREWGDGFRSRPNRWPRPSRVEDVDGFGRGTPGAAPCLKNEPFVLFYDLFERICVNTAFRRWLVSACLKLDHAVNELPHCPATRLGGAVRLRALDADRDHPNHWWVLSFKHEFRYVWTMGHRSPTFVHLL